MEMKIIRKNNLLFAAFVVVTLVMPIFAGNSMSTPAQVSAFSPAEDGPAIATIEAMGTYVDEWGGVRNVIASFQNATHYGDPAILDLEDIVTNQMENDGGYVSYSVLNMNGMTPFPNGVIGATMAQLQMTVLPVIEFDGSDADFVSLSLSEAITIADEYAAYYETALGVNFDRLMTIESTAFASWDFIGSETLEGTGYQFTYVDVLEDLTSAQTVMQAMSSRMAEMGGFMDFADMDDIAMTMLSQFTEVYFAAHWPEMDFGWDTSFVGNMLTAFMSPYIRSTGFPDLVETVQSALMGQANFHIPGYVESVAGNETYSLKDHTGLTTNVQNKMAQVPSAGSISVIGAAAPGSTTISGIPSNWHHEGDDYEIPEEVVIPGGITLPAGTTISELITTYLSYLPREYALIVNDGMDGLDPTIVDDPIDLFWGGVGPALDLKQVLLAVDFENDFPDTVVEDINFDLLAEIMEQAGLTPSALISRIDSDLADANPLAAVVKAFIDYFDAYGILDILDNDIYADVTALEGYLNTFGDGVGQFLSDFMGFDAPSEFVDKEAIADFVEEHWELTLQALWDAMAADDLTAMKNALHAMLDDENLREHVTPYLMADLGASLVGGIGFEFAINFDLLGVYELDVSDIVLEFDADPASVTFDGAYLALVKSPSTRIVPAGGTVDYNITVHNYGTETAYDVKVIDGMNAGLDGDRDFYWTRSTLAPGATWIIEYSVLATDGGLYNDMVALCVYFNQTIDTFDPDIAELWTGSAYYTWSAPGYQILVQGDGGGFWDALPSEIFGIPTLYVAAGVGGVAVLGVVMLLLRRR